MRIGLLAAYVSALGVWPAAAQGISASATLSDACIELNQAALNRVATGRLAEAESVLSEVLASPANALGPSCTGALLHNMAVVMERSGRLAEAEVFAARSISILDKLYSPDDPARLRPLLMLSSVQFQQGKLGQGRQTFRAIQSLRLARPEDRAMVHSATAAQFQTEGRYQEAEYEYFKALRAWQEAGTGENADVAMVLCGLAALHLVQGRNLDAATTLDRALAIVLSVKDAVPMDHIKILNVRGALHTRQGDWKAAEEDLRTAITIADRDARLDPRDLKLMLASYAYVLRKAHRRAEARSVEARAAAIQSSGVTNAVVDISELSKKANPGKR